MLNFAQFFQFDMKNDVAVQLPWKSVHLSKKPSEACQEISPSPRDNCKNYCKRNYSELEPVQKQKSKVGLMPFTLYKEVYTINLCHIYKPPQRLYLS